MSKYTPPDLTGEPLVSIRMYWRAANHTENTYTEWFDGTDNNLEIIHEIKEKLQASLGGKKAFKLETDDGFSSHEGACKALNKTFESFHNHNGGKTNHRTINDSDDMNFEDEEPQLGFIRLHWRAASQKTRTKTEWFPNTATNLELISSIRRSLEGSLGKGGSFLYDFDDGVDSRLAARDLIANLPVHNKNEILPPEPSNDP